MLQIFKKREHKNSEQTAENSHLDEMRQVFNEVKNKNVSIPPTRIVNLVFNSCCGCGCSDIKVMREVEYDSPLQDGHRIEELLTTDTVV